MDSLVGFGLNLQDVTIVGHSLGSHIAGQAAKQLKSPEKIGCIIGLDPASVRFDFFDKDKRLADTDAEYVEIIHTDSDKFGFSKPLGHGKIKSECNSILISNFVFTFLIEANENLFS